QFLDGVSSVLRFGRVTKGITFYGFRQDHGRLAIGLDRLSIGSINLERIVSTAVQLHDVIIRQVLDHLQQLRTLAEEMLASIGATTAPVVDVFTVHNFVHALLQQAVLVGGKQGVPVTSPDDLD